METKLLLAEHVDPLFAFEFDQLGESLSEMQKEMQAWDQPWRKESLNHYASLGWSFIVEKDGDIQGYLLGQPFLFFNNWTQSLWIEHLSFREPEAGALLLDTTIRWAKSKHLQKVLFNSQSEQAPFAIETVGGFKEGSYFHLSTTKMQE